MNSKAVQFKGAIAESDQSIFLISKLARKALQQQEKRISTFGSWLEMCLNIMYSKSNFSLLAMNLMRGKVVLPNRDSANFLSTVGLLDNRVELDKNIKPGSNKYFAAISAMASKLAYENNEFIRVTVEEIWKMELLGVYKFSDETHRGETTQAFMFRDTCTNPEMIFVAFRGTELFSAADWRTDLDIPWYKFPHIKLGNVHSGFMKALGLKSDGTWPEHGDAYNTITEDLKHNLETNPQTKFVLTGHSLGGALAVLYPAVLAMHNEVKVIERLRAVYTFGQPRVGDEEFGRFMKEKLEYYRVGYYRFVYSHDIVPRLPFDDSEMKFKHFGTCLYVNTLYEAEVVDEVPRKNYFDRGSSFVTKRVDAVWELVRSFLLPRMFGHEYKEGLLLKMFRVVGLVWPGGPAHGPQDYINATRLATNY